MMRLFIAVPLPKDIARAVVGAEEELRRMSTAGRFVPEGNHHITVRFIGESNALADVAAAMHEAVCDAKPFLLRLDGYGCFTHGGARTSFVRVGGDLAELSRIHQTLEAALWERGFDRGRGRLEPHITLGRAVEHDPDQKPFVPNEAFWVRQLVLFESSSERGGIRYAPLHAERF